MTNSTAIRPTFHAATIQKMPHFFGFNRHGWAVVVDGARQEVVRTYTTAVAARANIWTK